MRIGITGASGFVGRRLAELAKEKGHAVVRFGRSGADRAWDPVAGPPDLKDLDAVVHLAGDPVAEGRWTAAKKDRIRDSRVVGTRNLVAAFAPGGPKILVSASAIGYYGDRADEELTEDSAPGADFLAGVCRGWEEEARKAPARGIFDPSVRGEEDLFKAIETIADRHLGRRASRAVWKRAMRRARLELDARDRIERAALEAQTVSDIVYFYAGLAFGLTWVSVHRDP